MKSAAATWIKFGFEYGSIVPIVFLAFTIVAVFLEELTLEPALQANSVFVVVPTASLTILGIFWCFVTLGWDDSETD